MNETQTGHCSAVLALLLFAVLSSAFYGCRKSEIIEVQTAHLMTGQTMGTTYQIRVVVPATRLAELSELIDAELQLVNQQMSTYLPDSELSRFNTSANAGEWVEVSQATAEVVAQAQEISQKTSGAFDVTVGPLVNLWGFGADGLPERIPTPAEVDAQMAYIGFDKVSVQRSPAALRKTLAETQVDLSAIAKGHGVDRVAKLLDEQLVNAYFIEIGGEVRTAGIKPSGEAWRLGIEKPVVGQREIFTVLELGNASVATSGSYRNLYEYEGKRYSHTIDPRTGQPVQDAIVSATVVSESCALSDGIATSMMCLGFEDGLALANREAWAVLLIADQGGQLSCATSKAFDEQFPEWAEPIGAASSGAESNSSLGQ